VLIVELVRVNIAGTVIIVDWGVLIDFCNVIVELNSDWYLFLFFVEVLLLLNL